MEVGITHLVIRRQGGDLEAVLPLVKEAGYDGMEVLLTEDGDLTMNATAADCEKVRRLFDDAGMNLQSMCINCARGSLTTGKPEDADLFRKVTRKAAEVCQEIGVDNILIIPGGVTPDVPYDVCYDRALEGLKTLGPICDDTGVSLAVEYVWNNFFLSPLELRQCLDAVNHPLIGFYMDTGNMMAFGYAEQWIRILGPHIKKIHTKNFKRRPKWEWPNLLSDGDADWDLIMAAIREINYDGPLISEMSGSWEQHAENAEFTRKLIAG